MKKIAGKYIKSTTVYALMILSLSGVLTGCGGEADTVVVPPITGSLPSEDTGTLYPMIQKVYPGTLQSLNIPQSYPEDVSPEYPGIVTVFSHIMENDNNEMNSSFELIDVTTSEAVAINVLPASSSKYFTISPVSGTLGQNTEYILRIYKYAAAYTSITTASVSRTGNRAVIVTGLNHGLTDNEIVTITGFTTPHDGYNAGMVSVQVESSTSFSYDNTGVNEVVTDDTTGSVIIYSRTLAFNNLVTPPAVTISPADPLYVEYKFRTGNFASEDITPPSIAFTNITDGATNVTADPVAGDGYIEIIFSDNKVPMIDPFTVNDLSVTLYNTTGGTLVGGNILCVYTDTDFKTFRFYPTTPNSFLDASTEYRLRISASPYYITDFAGNNITQRDIYFSTGP